MKRINVLIREDQHQLVSELGVSLSGLIRDLLDDHFSDATIRLHISPKTKKLYDQVISNFGATDRDLEKHLLAALSQLLSEKQDEIKKIKKRIEKGS